MNDSVPAISDLKYNVAGTNYVMFNTNVTGGWKIAFTPYAGNNYYWKIDTSFPDYPSTNMYGTTVQNVSQNSCSSMKNLRKEYLIFCRGYILRNISSSFNCQDSCLFVHSCLKSCKHKYHFSFFFLTLYSD